MGDDIMNHSNLPASFDVTPLLSKLEHLEKDGRGDLIQRVRLIELDPYYHRSPTEEQQQTANVKKTRLFVVVAFGKNVVVAQLLALELERAATDNDEDMSTEEGGLDAEEELEWIDVSSDRVLPRRGDKADEIGVGDPVVVFPPSRAESLPAYLCAENTDDNVAKNDVESSDDGMFKAEITSCALIPSPTVQTVCSTSTNSKGELMTQRTVALMLGTAHDQLLSLLLSVSLSGETSMDNNTRFVLEYDECKIIENGTLKKQGDKIDDYAKHPCVHQILPYEKRFSTDDKEDNDGNVLSNSFDEHNNNLDEHIKMYHPSLQSAPPQHLNKGDKQKVVAHSGITSISFFRDNMKSRSFGAGAIEEEDREVVMDRDIVWITFGNGTIIKLPAWKPFLMFGSTGGGIGDSSNLVDSTHVIGNGSSVTPLCSPFQSPLDVPPSHRSDPLSLEDESKPIAQGRNADEYWNLLSLAVGSPDSQLRSNCEQHADPSVQAFVLTGPSASASTPPIAFNSSRMKCDVSALAQKETAASSEYGSPKERGLPLLNDERDDSVLDMSSDDEQFGPVTGTVVEGTSALVRGALGVALGAVRWGLGVNEERDNHNDDDTPLDEFMDVDETINGGSIINGSPEQLKRTRNTNGHGTDLFPWPLNSVSFAFSDIPRRFETAKVDPSGSLVATTDNLGRVILFDVETNQPIRMIKGMRNVTCSFSELPHTSYLVIHLRQRGSVEVYRLVQGPRVAAIAVPQQKDCVVVECHGPPAEDNRVGIFLLERINESDRNHSEGCHYIIDKLVIDDPDATSTLPKKEKARTTSQSENKMQLKLLMQLLAPDTNIQCNSQTVFATFKSIHALADLGEGLDAISKCNRLESEMGIDGSKLHSQAVAYCKSRLHHAKQMESQEGSGLLRKANISELTLKVAYHDQLNLGYKVLNTYETGRNYSSRDDQEVGSESMENLSPWASEALSWISAASGNDAQKTMFMSPSPRSVRDQSDNKPLEFSKFAIACQPNGDNDRVYLTKVKKNRLPILRRCFCPLLQDLFVFKVCNSLFSHLGIDEDFDIQQQYFGEWCATLDSHEIINSNFTGTWRPMSRWLQDLILSAYDASQLGTNLETLLKFCMEMEDLPKAFLLAVVCMDAVSSASLQLEEKTYGKITQLESVRPWEDLLRKLRVCLLVSLRLAGDVNPFGGVNPMTVSSVSRPDIFSAFSWIAKDELSLSQDNEVIIALETACISSSEGFYPAAADCDSDEHKKTIFQSCSNPRQGLSLHNPTGLTNDTHSRPLLFFMKDIARFTTRLAANRALILASLWGQSPEHLHLLNHAMSALQIIVNRVEGFSLATLVEIYQTRIRPVCRAMLFGFGEHELSEEVVSPLIEDPVWIREFISCAKRILSMIIEVAAKLPPSTDPINDLEASDMWPPLRECPVLEVLVMKLGDVQQSSVELHHTVIFAFEMTGNIDSLQSVVKSFSSLFLLRTLFHKMPPMPKGAAEQKALLDKAIVDRAETTISPVVDNFNGINDVELFGKALGLDIKYARTHYLIEMIRLGKDTSVNDILGASTSTLDKSIFAENVIPILCARQDATITRLKHTKHYRGILSILDADTSRWVREEAAKCQPSQQNTYAAASLISTHSLVMRLQNMFESQSDNKALSEKINSLCLMTGTLLKAVQSHEQEAVMSV